MPWHVLIVQQIEGALPCNALYYFVYMNLFIFKVAVF
jgi:hypothetical protein